MILKACKKNHNHHLPGFLGIPAGMRTNEQSLTHSSRFSGPICAVTLPMVSIWLRSAPTPKNFKFISILFSTSQMLFSPTYLVRVILILIFVLILRYFTVKFYREFFPCKKNH